MDQIRGCERQTLARCFHHCRPVLGGHLEWLQQLHGSSILAQTAANCPRAKDRTTTGRPSLEAQGFFFDLSGISNSIGNNVEAQRFLIHTLQLWRWRGDSDYWVARALKGLSGVNSALCSYKEGIQQAREAAGISERLGDIVEQARLARSLLDDKRSSSTRPPG
jgi:hypothetical protein